MCVRKMRPNLLWDTLSYFSLHEKELERGLEFVPYIMGYYFSVISCLDKFSVAHTALFSPYWRRPTREIRSEECGSITRKKRCSQNRLRPVSTRLQLKRGTKSIKKLAWRRFVALYQTLSHTKYYQFRTRNTLLQHPKIYYSGIVPE